tara:strand:+ start:1295 stop:1435 length:141 start_codon:yes stop_codon:yes gene_type:complete
MPQIPTVVLLFLFPELKRTSLNEYILEGGISIRRIWKAAATDGKTF